MLRPDDEIVPDIYLTITPRHELGVYSGAVIGATHGGDFGEGSSVLGESSLLAGLADQEKLNSLIKRERGSLRANPYDNSDRGSLGCIYRWGDGVRDNLRKREYSIPG